MSAKVIAITNQKGGVGKTTTTVNLSHAMAAAKRRVLLIDLDPQGNATMGSGVDKNAVSNTVCDVLLDGMAIEKARVHVEEHGFDVLPANGDLTAAEVGLIEAIAREQVLARALDPVLGEYDYIFIDCPPALNMLTLNALSAANGVLIPMQTEYFALEGLSALVDTMDKIRRAVNPKLQVYGVLRTMYDPRNNLARDVSGQLVKFFKDKVFNTVIPRNVRLAEAPSHGLPIMAYDKSSRGAQAYLALAGEMLRRDQKIAKVV